MHIAFVIQRFPGFGGAEEYVYQLTLRLSKRGYSCTIITSNLNKGTTRKLPPTATLIKMPILFRIGEYAIWKGLIGKLNRIRKVNLFHVNTYGYYHSDVVSILSRIRKFRTIFTSHGFHGLELFFHLCKGNIGYVPNFAKMKLILRPFHDFTLGRNELLSADALIALTKRDRRIYTWAGVDENKIHEIPVGVREQFFGSAINEEELIRFQKEIDGNPILLSVGELSWVKGKDIAIKAMAFLQKEYPNAKLVLVGRDGGMYDYLKRLAYKLGLQDKVVFLGYLPTNALKCLYHVADVLVHTSYAEGLSTIILESMASGLPVVSTPAGGNSYALQESNAGVVVPFNNPYLTSVGIARALEKRKAFGENGVRYALEHFQWSSVVSKHLSLYQKLMS